MIIYIYVRYTKKSYTVKLVGPYSTTLRFGSIRCLWPHWWRNQSLCIIFIFYQQDHFSFTCWFPPWWRSENSFHRKNHFIVCPLQGTKLYMIDYLSESLSERNITSAQSCKTFLMFDIMLEISWEGFIPSDNNVKISSQNLSWRLETSWEGWSIFMILLFELTGDFTRRIVWLIAGLTKCETKKNLQGFKRCLDGLNRCLAHHVARICHSCSAKLTWCGSGCWCITCWSSFSIQNVFICQLWFCQCFFWSYPTPDLLITRWVLKIADFGLGDLLDDPPEQHLLYQAPELLRRADVF